MEFTGVLSLWREFSFVTAAVIFFLYILIDGLYAYYTMAVTEKRPMRAAMTASTLHLLLAIGVLSYVDNYLYVMPLVAGSWIGTFIMVRRSKSKSHSRAR